jgi:hypothetical protein
MGRVGRVGVLLSLLLPGSAAAEGGRREGPPPPTSLSLTLPVTATFAGVVVPARRYRLSVVATGLALADPDTMVLVATLPVTDTQVADAVTEPTVTVQQRGTTVEISVRWADRWLRATGAAGGASSSGAAPIAMADKAATAVPAATGEELTDVQLVAVAVQRLLGGVKHCGENAKRRHWETDDPRFVKCLCPIALRWHLPKVREVRVTHHVLLKDKNGFSLTVTPTGHVSLCRVWVGEAPPAPPEPLTPTAPAGTGEPPRAGGDPR